MECFIQLSSSEAKVVNPILAGFSQRARFPISLDYLVEGWQTFVVEVEKGYNASIYDYTNDLSGRDLLQELASQVPGSVVSKLMEVIQPWDTRFVAATREIQYPLRGSKTATSRFWLMRVPIILREELEGDLRSEGVLE